MNIMFLRQEVLRLIIFLILICAALTACAPNNVKMHENFVPRAESGRVLLMPLDLELSELTAAGLLEPKAAWTAAAREHMREALRERMAQAGAALVHYDPAARDRGTVVLADRMTKLHEAVGMSILQQTLPVSALPTKTDRFDWTLGPQVAALGAAEEADYALFVFMRDSYASAGRTAMIIGAALLGVGMQGGVQTGFASLVDLRTGDVAWFNHFARAQGDLRNADDAREAVTTLLEGLPL